MRPVERGARPVDAAGALRVFAHYREARDPLIDQIGDHCSYCELPLHEGPDVEHVKPKSLYPGLERDWRNFLLGCCYCNAIKADEDLNLADYFWPDRDNTFRAFDYPVDLPPQPAGMLSAADRQKAQRTLELTGLDRVPGHPRFSERDLRWRKRRQAWGVALLSLQNLRQHDSEAMRTQITLLAASRGFFSIWMTVFREDPDMKRRLIASFPGTALSCFDANGDPVPRPGGAI